MIETAIVAGTSARPTEAKPFSCEDGDSRANQAVSPFSVALQAATPSRTRPDGLASASKTGRDAQQDTLKSTGRNTPGESSVHGNARQHADAMRYAANDRARAEKPDSRLPSLSTVSVNEEKEEATSVNEIPDTSPPAQTLLEPAVFLSAPPPTPGDLSAPRVPADSAPGNQPATRESLTISNQAQGFLLGSAPLIDQNHGEAGHDTPKTAARAGTEVDHGKDAKLGENSALNRGFRSTYVPESKYTDGAAGVQTALSNVAEKPREASGALTIKLTETTPAWAIPSPSNGDVSGHPLPADVLPLSTYTAPTAPGFADELGMDLQLMMRDGMEKAELTLNPVDLGPIFIELKVREQIADITFSVANPVTREAVAQSLPQLTDLLAQKGLALGDANVAGNHSRSGSYSDQRAPQRQLGGSEQKQGGTESATISSLGRRRMLLVAAATARGGIDHYA